jgi:hypothetical protein
MLTKRKMRTLKLSKILRKKARKRRRKEKEKRKGDLVVQRISYS